MGNSQLAKALLYTLLEVSAIRHFEHSDAIEIRDGITFDFYTGLPYIYIYIYLYVCIYIHIQRKKCFCGYKQTFLEIVIFT